jgi:DNA-binding transcriptional LysR family regulator
LRLIFVVAEDPTLITPNGSFDSGEIGSASSTTERVVPLFVVSPVVDFLRRHQKVQAELVFNDRYVNLVEEGFDLVVRVEIPSDTTARGRKLVDSRRILVASPAYLDAHGRPKVPKDLKEHECLVHGESNPATVWRFSRNGGAGVPVPVRGRLAANNSEAVLLMAQRGLGIALLADWLVEADLKRGRLVSLLDDFSAPPAPVYALVPPSRFASPTIGALTEHLVLALLPRLVPGKADRARG